jgi:hypothetical protein
LALAEIGHLGERSVHQLSFGRNEAYRLGRTYHYASAVSRDLPAHIGIFVFEASVQSSQSERKSAPSSRGRDAVLFGLHGTASRSLLLWRFPLPGH